MLLIFVYLILWVSYGFYGFLLTPAVFFDTPEGSNLKGGYGICLCVYLGIFIEQLYVLNHVPVRRGLLAFKASMPA